MTETQQKHHDHLEKFFKSGRRFLYKKGEIIVRGDDTPAGVYFIEEGFIKVYSITKHGNENIRVILRPGEIFPVIWAFNGTSKRSLFYESFGGAALWRVSREDFLHYTKSSVESSQVVTNSLINLFSIYASRIDNLEYDNARDRVAYLLLLHAKRFGSVNKQSVTLGAPINHQHIADSVNLARETTSRVLSRFEKKGLISYKTVTSYKGLLRYKNRSIVINKFDDLARYFDEPDRLNPWN